MKEQKIFGYMRVSTREQNEERQRLALLEMGVPKEKEADIVVIDMPILDTRREKNLLGTLISDIVLALLSYAAENERANIRQRQAEGIAAAKARGVKFGRPEIIVPDNFYEIYKKWRKKEVSVKEAAKACNLAKSTFFDKVRKLEKCDS